MCIRDRNEEELKLLADENKRESLRIAAVNSLFPGRWRLSDPRVDKTEYLEYAEKLFSVMELLGVPYAVFGSGSARTIPDDVDFDDGADELYGFLLSLCLLYTSSTEIDLVSFLDELFRNAAVERVNIA